ncbi:hypothetical protein [Microbacterium sp.]|uniref:hypothetical protein n=1 Tax=Microbacterium sp. TaxID=51671 RepID=UPI003340DA30
MPTEEEAARLLQIARESRMRGDLMLHLQLRIARLSGEASSWGSADNSVTRDDGVGVLLGEVERIGWRLEHTGYVFIEGGSTSSARMFSTGTGVVNHGAVEGCFTFRRTTEA